MRRVIRALSVACALLLASVASLSASLPLAAQDVDCTRFATQADAQVAFAANPAAAPALDPDGDGQVCEDTFDPESWDDGERPLASSAASRRDVDCKELIYQQTAQQVLEEDLADPFNLDPSGDGVACASLPSMPGASPLSADSPEPVDSLDAAPAQPVESPGLTDPAPVEPAKPAQPTGSRLKAELNDATADIGAFWNATYQDLDGGYTSPTIRMFQKTVQTGCGPFETGVGPFYCPVDQTFYIDMPITKEFEILQDPFVMRMIFAHEWAHHIQYLSGYEIAIFPDQRGEVLSLQLELHADCLAGVWAQSAVDAGEATEEDLLTAMDFAYMSGDPPEVPLLAPDAHGTGEMRQGAFEIGLEHGDPQLCEREILNLL
jgi:predicted metalloprotease